MNKWQREALQELGYHEREDGVWFRSGYSRPPDKALVHARQLARRLLRQLNGEAPGRAGGAGEAGKEGGR